MSFASKRLLRHLRAMSPPSARWERDPRADSHLDGIPVWRRWVALPKLFAILRKPGGERGSRSRRGAPPPFGEDVGLDRPRLEPGPVQVLEQLASGQAEAAVCPRFVEVMQEFADRLIELDQAWKRLLRSLPSARPTFLKRMGAGARRMCQIR